MGVLLSTPITTKESAQAENDRLRFGASSMQGWRTGMEDAHLGLLSLTDHISLFGVFDGHGGREVSRFISHHLPKLLSENQNFTEGKFEQALKECYLQLDDLMESKEAKLELYQFSEKKPANTFQNALETFLTQTQNCHDRNQLQQEVEKTKNERKEQREKQEQEEQDESNNAPNVDLDTLTHGHTSGSTAISALIDFKNNEVFVANVGDSRCVVSRDQTAVELSIDHKPQNQNEYQRIMKAGGFVQNGRVNGDLNLSRAIGDKQYKKNAQLPPEEQMITAFPEVKTLNLSSTDEFLVLACDGIWDVKTNQQVVDFVGERIKNGVPLSIICEQLLDACLAPDPSGVGTDNMTVLIIDFKCRNTNAFSN